MAPGSLTVAEGDQSTTPDLRILHFNDVYHVEPGSRDPVGGIARFQTLCNQYRSDPAYGGQPELVTFFSGDAFNPSLESSVTKGSHMVPILNGIGVDAAVVGNHDFDFGIPQYKQLVSGCKFPWLLANLLDPCEGSDVPLGNSPRTHMITSSNGIKIGVIGLCEEEWVCTVNALPPDLPFVQGSEMVKRLAPQLREQGAEMIVALCHQREVNDRRLASEVPQGMIDIILAGHDHDYRYAKVSGTHILCSGSDFKQLSYIEARRRRGGEKGWDFTITRRDVTKDIPEDPTTVTLIDKLFSSFRKKLDKSIGYTAAPLDARFTTVRKHESNLGNFCCDILRNYFQGDCCIMAGGTIRGDQVYPPGVLRLKDIMDCFPFEDPTVMIGCNGQAIWDCLENAVSQWPALEGRFPQVANIKFSFDPSKPAGRRVQSLQIAGEEHDPERTYKLVTRQYMVQGGDGFSSLVLKSQGGSTESLVDEENGMLLSTILRQYFMSLKILGRWKNWSDHMGHTWSGIHEDVHDKHPIREPKGPKTSPAQDTRKRKRSHSPRKTADSDQGQNHLVDKALRDERPTKATAQPSNNATNEDHHLSDSEDDANDLPAVPAELSDSERRLILIRKVARKWWRLTGLKGHPAMCDEQGEEFGAHWTRAICPRVEGRITIINAPA